MRIRVWIRSFFGFSRSETNAFLILLPAMAVLVLSAPAYRWWLGRRPIELQENSKLLDSLVASWKWDKPAGGISKELPSLFSFNPNTASLDDLKSLGFSDGLSLRIVNYRAKGGKFKVKRDLGKLYGMDSLLMTRLYPYIDLPEKIISAATKRFPVATSVHSIRFDLNLADTAQLIKIYGIGPRLSMRIIKYRDRLGGFISHEQLPEVYGLDTAVINQLKKRTFIRDDFKPRQINVNAADEKEFRSLPYIPLHLAKSIAAYRFQHGDFASLEALKQIALMDESLFQKIKPYLTVKD
ncbi:MAG TPA: helix-hairpin-helix domain-containing protein [Cyclobacteriaceae bacterium]|jgi:competence protein ComEA|nr:helix-hairpin-helix domain-containing protein [Cyclobacteriaceae bacterium]